MDVDIEDDDFLPRPFEHGHWEWSEDTKQLVFVSDKILSDMTDMMDIGPQTIRKIEFKNEMDLIEEQWFKKHYQRQYSEDDVVRLQDVKDVVLFTAPKQILKPEVIGVLHLRAMDRFQRALIFYCQYYLQIASEMADRILELQNKVKTERGKQIEDAYEENLQDIRLLLAKEYCGLVLGTGEYTRYHHMGVKKISSLTKKDSLIFETLLPITTYIVWIALGRKSFPQIEVEVQRVFKSNVYNVAKRRFKTDFEKEMSNVEYNVIYGSCEHRENTLRIHSPLLKEFACSKNPVDYRLFGIGDVEYPKINARLLYFKNILSAPENVLEDLGLSIGIIGLPRRSFDTMLREVKKQTSSVSSVSLRKTASRMSSSRSSAVKSTKSMFVHLKLYPDVILPDKGSNFREPIPDVFPNQIIPIKFPKNKQRLKWLQMAIMMKKKEKIKYNTR